MSHIELNEITCIAADTPSGCLDDFEDADHDDENAKNNSLTNSFSSHKETSQKIVPITDEEFLDVFEYSSLTYDIFSNFSHDSATHFDHAAKKIAEDIKKISSLTPEEARRILERNKKSIYHRLQKKYNNYLEKVVDKHNLYDLNMRRATILIEISKYFGLTEKIISGGQLLHYVDIAIEKDDWKPLEEFLEQLSAGFLAGWTANRLLTSFLTALSLTTSMPIISAGIIAITVGYTSYYFSERDNINSIKEKFNEFKNSLLRYFNGDDVFIYDSEQNIITNLSKTIQYNVSENTLLVNKDLALADELPNSVRLMDKAIKVIGNSQDNYLYGNAHNNILEGKNGNDHLFGDLGDDRLFGQEGNDYINGGIGNDFLYGEAGNDILEGAEGNDRLEAGYGNDQLSGGSGNDVLYGQQGDDTLNGGEGDDFLYGEAGNDILEGAEGNDRLEAGYGNDQLSGGSGNDVLYGQQGDDTLNGGEGDDFLYGEAGNDILEGAEGNDKLEAGEGNDQLFGGLGNDMLYGATGNDTYYFSNNFGEDVIIDNNGNDRIIFDDNIDIRKMLLSLEQGDLKISFIDKNDNITVKGWKNRSFQIETIEARDGMKLNNHQLDHLINEMAVFFSQSTSIDAQSVTESKLIELYSNFGIVQIP